MSFDSHSLERLRELGRRLPKPLPSTIDASKPTQKVKASLHPVETEQNPQALFKELIKASPDGKIPSHLMDRLKKIELMDLEKKAAHNKNNTFGKNQFNSMSNKKERENISSIAETDDLYISFKQLLLEEEP